MAMLIVFSSPPAVAAGRLQPKHQRPVKSAKLSHLGVVLIVLGKGGSGLVIEAICGDQSRAQAPDRGLHKHEERREFM